jgi:hypothetical protein
MNQMLVSCFFPFRIQQLACLLFQLSFSHIKNKTNNIIGILVYLHNIMEVPCGIFGKNSSDFDFFIFLLVRFGINVVTTAHFKKDIEKA